MINKLNRKWINVSFPVFLLLIASGCALPWFSNSIENVVTSEPPVIEATDLSPFQNIGCIWQSEDYAVCPEDSIPKKMGCDTLSTPKDFVDLVSPDRQFVNCSYAPLLQSSPDKVESEGLYDSGCSTPIKQRLLVYENGDYLLIRNLDDLQYNFTPINSSEQALGYAIAATGFSARYDLDDLKDYRILADVLEETSVEQTSDGFEIVLYTNQMCGCGPHTTFMKKVKVTNTGDIQIIDSIPAFENPEEDNLCVD
jgi:hypothetical protein